MSQEIKERFNLLESIYAVDETAETHGLDAHTKMEISKWVEHAADQLGPEGGWENIEWGGLVEILEGQPVLLDQLAANIADLDAYMSKQETPIPNSGVILRQAEDIKEATASNVGLVCGNDSWLEDHKEAS